MKSLMGKSGTTPVVATPYSRHIPALDGLRAFAVMGVLATHLFPGNAQGAATLVRSAFGFGVTGVDLFFVLSGFLITGILYDSLEDPFFFRKFYARRILRIFPLYYGVIAAFVVQGIVLALPFRRELLSLALYLQNTAWVAPHIWEYRGDPKIPLGHFWSLAVEEQFYLGWPLIVYLVRDRKRLLIFCAVAMLLCPAMRLMFQIWGMPISVINANTLFRMDTLLAGGALALLERGRARDVVLRLAPWGFTAGALAYAVYAFLPQPEGLGREVMESLRYSALALMYAGATAMCLSVAVVRALCSVKLLRWVGKYSYGIYVFHFILFAYLQQPIRAALDKYVTSNKGIGVILTGMAVVILSAVVAYISYNVYECRFLALKRYFDYCVSSGDAA